MVEDEKAGCVSWGEAARLCGVGKNEAGFAGGYKANVVERGNFTVLEEV